MRKERPIKIEDIQSGLVRLVNNYDTYQNLAQAADNSYFRNYFQGLTEMNKRSIKEWMKRFFPGKSLLEALS